MSDRFAGQTALVTGALGGIGQAICRAFAREGARVVVADLPDAPFDGLVQELGNGSFALSLDVTREEDWTRAFSVIEAEAGSLDILVNNAGFFRPNIAFEDMSLDLWRRHFAVNAEGSFLGCRSAIRHMKHHGGGSIVNIGSGMSIVAAPTSAAYCSSKAALLMLTKVAAKSGGPYNVRVNAVLPGAVDTDMLMGNLTEGQSPQEYLAMMAHYSAMGKLAGVDDIAHAVLMLADRASSAVSGVHVPVDCGAMPGS